MDTPSSAFMLLFHELPPEVFQALSDDERQQMSDEWNQWYDGLAAEGKVQHGHPLEPAVRIVTGTRGERVLDGPFAEAKEAIGGYFLLTVADLDEATRIAQRCPCLRLGMKVEVRTVAEACPTLGVKGRAKEAAHA